MFLTLRCTIYFYLIENTNDDAVTQTIGLHQFYVAIYDHSRVLGDQL